MQQTHPSPRFLFWPQYGEEAQWWEEEEEEEAEEAEGEETEAKEEG
ncbi:unnamed protein product, partial [Hydatigera taeniaeformis]|uniref:Uncharacterized protein n=1 Tax=Hydatigena taeniaeformis TaxID=6205 RepID=A0A0R3XDE4_HYDTA